MYARVTTFTGDAERIDEVVALVEDRAAPALEEQPGSRGLSLMVDRDHGRVVVTSLWDTERNRTQSAAALAALRAEAAELIRGAARVDEYDVAVSEQVTGPGPGCWARVTALAFDPVRLRDGTAFFQSQVVRTLRDVPGFLGAALLVDTAAGRAVGSAFWADRAALDASRDAAAALRGEVPGLTGGRVTGVSEYEVVLSRLRVPRLEHLFRLAYERMSAGDLDGLDELVAEGITEHAPLPPGYPSGRDGVKTWVREFRTAFPDLRMTIERFVEDGDTATAVVRATGTHRGPLLGHPATGRSIDVTMIDVVRVVDDRAVEHWAASDDLGMLQQLGITTVPGAEAVPPQPAVVDLTGQRAPV